MLVLLYARHFWSVLCGVPMQPEKVQQLQATLPLLGGLHLQQVTAQACCTFIFVQLLPNLQPEYVLFRPLQQKDSKGKAPIQARSCSAKLKTAALNMSMPYSVPRGADHRGNQTLLQIHCGVGGMLPTRKAKPRKGQLLKVVFTGTC